MNRPTIAWMVFCAALLAAVPLQAQVPGVESDLERLMIRYEEKVLQAYQEKQTLAHQPNAHLEFAAFDSIISAYTKRVLEIYETLNRIKGFTLENYRQIASRSLIFRALAFVENPQLDPVKARRACEDYRRALLLTKSSKIPIISQQLPYEVWIDHRLYTRLADLLDERDYRRVLLGCMRNIKENGKP